MAYLRLHGRNGESWRLRSAQCSGYCYDGLELEEVASATKKLALSARATFVMFNNCQGGYAIKNGLKLKSLLAPAAKNPTSTVD